MRLVIALVVALGGPVPALAATPLDWVALSPDATLVAGGFTVADEQVWVDDLGAGAGTLSLGGLEAAAAVDAFHDAGGGELWFSLAAPTVIGGALYAPEDVVRFAGGGYSLVFDGDAAGVPAGADLDAVTADAAGLLLSFDVAVTLPGAGVVDDADLVRWTGAGFVIFFDAALAGVPAALDVDGAQWLSNGNLLLSFDTGGTLGGVAFADEDVLEHTPGLGSWELAYDASASDAAWAAVDADALTAGVLGAPVGADLQLTKVASVATAQPGDTIVYTLAVGNLGPLDAHDVVLADPLAPATTLVATTGCAEDPAGVPTCTLGLVPAGSSVAVTVEVTVDAGASGLLVNQASVSSATPDPVAGNETATTFVVVSDSVVPAIPTTSEWGLLLLTVAIALLACRQLTR